MAMSTHIVGFKPPDKRWELMHAIWLNCESAKVSIPKEVLDYFENVYPDSAGVMVKLDGVREWNCDHKKGFEIVIDEIPKDVKIIRFYNSW